jgi:rRNA-processing protein FCF1
MKVIIDTNFLLIPGTLGVDIFSQLKEIDPSVEMFIIDKTIDELNKIKKEQKRFRKAADLALQLVDKYKLQQIKTEKVLNVDKIILEKAQGYAVATQDKELKQQLKKKKIPIIVLRQKKYLKLQNVL